MSFTAAIRTVLAQYATFSGRAMRSEYWWFYLFTVIVSIVTAGIDALLNTVFDNGFGVVGLVTSLALLLPTWAVTVRRLHDMGRTGWWVLLPLVLTLALVVMGFVAVFVLVLNFGGGDASLTWLVTVPILVLVLLTVASLIVLLVFLCQGSEAGPNKYGPSPKGPLPTVGPFGGHHPTASGTWDWATPPPRP